MEGRILKVKTGYNPNSSSIGIDLIAFFTGAAVLTVLFNTITAIMASGPSQEHGRRRGEEAAAEPVEARVQG